MPPTQRRPSTRRGENESLAQLLPQLIPLSVGKRILEDLQENGPYERNTKPFERVVDCLDCRDTGELPVRVEPGSLDRTFRPCDKCGAADRFALAQGEKLREKFAGLGLQLPRKYDGYTWDNWPGIDKRALARIRQLGPKKPQSVLILGPIGTGKTSAAACLYREWAAVTPALWCAIPDVLDHIRQGYDPAMKAYKGSEMIEAISTAPLVMMDDVGPEHATPWVEEALYRVVSRRDDEQRPTIFTSNLTLAGIEEHLGGRTASRIEGMASGALITVTGDDIRKRARPKPATPR